MKLRRIIHHLAMTHLVTAHLVMGISLGAAVGSVSAQERRHGISFTDERLFIPDSESFNDGSYLSSGVGLKFGVDKRLTYLSGDYAGAVIAFEEATRTYRYMAEIWVYLARAYFYSESPELAKQTLERAKGMMPDLADRLWNPLIGSLLSEIRQRANQEQIQVDFYSPDQQKILSLFRLYIFLEDTKAAKGVIDTAHQRATEMRERTTMVAGSSQATYIDQAEQWDMLAASLSSEMSLLGEQPPPAPPASVAPEPVPIDAAAEQAAERERLLQLRIDYYHASSSEYEELFDAYLLRGDTRRARILAERARQEAARLGLVASVAATIQDEEEIKQKASTMDSLNKAFDAQLSGQP
ncbi:MAG: hypothetical protein QF768_14955 [Candidatus Latescibacteria bacterium]|nr:hypothetical protein [Candidatus Latescibacterota bacterium]MDP7633320.1 hypothetical protein [Candidatus Latescibacterota bacterium]